MSLLGAFWTPFWSHFGSRVRHYTPFWSPGWPKQGYKREGKTKRKKGDILGASKEGAKKLRKVLQKGAFLEAVDMAQV